MPSCYLRGQAQKPKGKKNKSALNLDQAPRPFKSGVARIAKATDVPVVPVYIKYNATPESSWFCSLPFPLQVILNAINPLQRKGCTVIIGNPIMVLPSSQEEVLKLIEERVNTLGGHK